MTKTEWTHSTDAGAMLDFLWQQRGMSPRKDVMLFGGGAGALATAQTSTDDFERALHRFYLASCRRIFALLPEQGSRDGVEMGEKFMNGMVSAEALSKFTWHTEAAAFEFDYNLHPDYTAPLLAAVRALPTATLRSMLHPPEAADDIEPRELLKRAAYFADYSMIYPSLKPKGPPPDAYRIFLPADLLREHIAYPDQPDGRE